MILLFFSLKYKFFRVESTLSCQTQQYCSSLHSQKENFPQVLAPGFSNLYCNLNWSTRPKRNLRIIWEHCEFWLLNKSLLMRNSDVWQVLSAGNFPFHQPSSKWKTLSALHLLLPQSPVLFCLKCCRCSKGEVEEVYNSWSSEQRVLEKATAVITGIKA